MAHQQVVVTVIRELWAVIYQALYGGQTGYRVNWLCRHLSHDRMTSAQAGWPVLPAAATDGDDDAVRASISDIKHRQSFVRWFSRMYKASTLAAY